jgi:hypothetical protein
MDHGKSRHVSIHRLPIHGYCSQVQTKDWEENWEKVYRDGGGHPVLSGGEERLQQRLLAASIQSTFLKKLGPEQKEYYKLDHEAEIKFIC